MNTKDRFAPWCRTWVLAGLVGMLFWAGCAFDLSHVKLVPATYTAATGSAPDFVLSQDVKVKLGTSYPTHLKGGTRWHQVGTTEFGTVFTTTDQVVTVEASNIYEAELVVSNQCIVGFYLPVDKKFAPACTARPQEKKCCP